jgi:hypothetical protein
MGVNYHFAKQQFATADVGSGSFSTLLVPRPDVRSSPNNDRTGDQLQRSKSANSGQSTLWQTNAYSSNSFARSSSCVGMVRPSVFAVLRLMINSNFVGC